MKTSKKLPLLTRLAGRRARFGLLSGLAVCGLSVWGIWHATASSSNVHTTPAAPSALVVRGPLSVTTLTDGRIQSCSNVILACGVEWKTTIVELIPEGVQVKEGDVICRLDKSDLETRLAQYQAYLTRSEASWKQAQEQHEIQKMLNEKTVSQAELQSQLAELNLKKYQDAELENQRRALRGGEILAEETLVQSQATYDFTKRMSEKGYSNLSEVEQARIDVTKSEIAHRVAEDKLQLHEQYTGQQTLTQLQRRALQTSQEVVRSKQRADLTLLQTGITVNAHNQNVLAYRTQVRRLERNIAACTIKAPKPGVVVYANSEQSRSGNRDRIEPGVEVRYRQNLVLLPDLTKMEVDVDIHESEIRNLRVGQPAAVQIDAFKDKVFKGRVTYVAPVPSPGEWPREDVRFYRAVVVITDELDATSGVRPGLTAKVAIEVDRRDDVLALPVAAVFGVGEEQRVQLMTRDGVRETPVLVGISNDKVVEICDGLNEGDRVMIDLPAGEVSSPAELNSQETDAITRVAGLE